MTCTGPQQSGTRLRSSRSSVATLAGIPTIAPGPVQAMVFIVRSRVYLVRVCEDHRLELCPGRLPYRLALLDRGLYLLLERGGLVRGGLAHHVHLLVGQERKQRGRREDEQAKPPIAVSQSVRAANTGATVCMGTLSVGSHPDVLGSHPDVPKGDEGGTPIIP